MFHVPPLTSLSTFSMQNRLFLWHVRLERFHLRYPAHMNCALLACGEVLIHVSSIHMKTCWAGGDSFKKSNNFRQRLDRYLWCQFSLCAGVDYSCFTSNLNYLAGTWIIHSSSQTSPTITLLAVVFQKHFARVAINPLRPPLSVSIHSQILITCCWWNKDFVKCALNPR